MSQIDVYVQIGDWPSDKDIRVRLQLDTIQREAMTPLDFAVHSPGFMTTPARVVGPVMVARECVAQQITRAIMKALGARDTHDGYPKEAMK